MLALMVFTAPCCSEHKWSCRVVVGFGIYLMPKKFKAWIGAPQNEANMRRFGGIGFSLRVRA